MFIDKDRSIRPISYNKPPTVLRSHLNFSRTLTSLQLRPKGLIEKERRNNLFYDALNTFLFTVVYGVGHIVNNYNGNKSILFPAARDLLYADKIAPGWNKKYLNCSTRLNQSEDLSQHEWTPYHITLSPPPTPSPPHPRPDLGLQTPLD